MNVIAYFGIISLYKDFTSRRMGWSNAKHGLTVDDTRWIGKYKRRGYRVLQDTAIVGDHECGSMTRCTQTVRRLTDKGVGVIRFREFRPIDNKTLIKTLTPMFMWKLRNNRCREKSDVEDGWALTEREYLKLEQR